ncbi:hypothetical protein CLU96_4453 [Chryseobacterium sp. 52]|uniref:hypothetical protein n=1 Tax=Chryseobacterium sp. 52 TaxID=2035213 RepID=UPI000C18D547|nr:hypothetical protein [Chryseobacterium sp. 52]PIF47401.1 hypothetical protein CLU96_4453 [Chryseobacterium sp. 52]
MLPTNAIQFIMQAPQFIAHIQSNGLDPNICHEINIRLINDEVNNISYFDVYFDYGMPGNGTKDVIATVKIIDIDQFQLVNIKFRS